MKKVQAVERELSAYRSSYCGKRALRFRIQWQVCYITRGNGEQEGQGNTKDAVGIAADPSFIFQFYMSQFETNQKHLTNTLIAL